MDYSKTVNLPTTDFPMKANLPQREPEILKKWEKIVIYKSIQAARSNAEPFILHDGPPYANGHLHMGHALNKILKDIIVKHKSMMGMRAPFVPGWDCHGLPIELNVTKELGKKAESMSKVEIRAKCRAYAEKFVAIQMDEFKRLGVFGDYDNPYKTLNPEYEAKTVETFGLILQEGYIYRRKKPIFWCPTCTTALAEAEIEYGDHQSPSIYVKFKIDPNSLKKQKVDPEQTSVVIWTTTPWTLPANLAVCFNPGFQYSAYRFRDEWHIAAKGLLMQLENAVGAEKDEEAELTLDDIKSLRVYHPFIGRESKVIFGSHVSLDAGTGIVHTAPGHGNEDYFAGLEYGLDVYSPVDDCGRFTDQFPEMKGVGVFESNPMVIDLLKSKNALIKVETIEHSYPHCWRCKNPIIFRATEQWFLSIDHNDLRKKTVKKVGDINWIPAWGESRFLGMVETRPDWCLSRQRSWGVPIPSFRCEKCSKNLMTAESVLRFADIARVRGIDAWYTEDIKDLALEGTKCSCGSDSFVKEYDILDVWFDSGVSHFAVLDTYKDHRWPSDLYLEGSDQHRGWFQSSLWPAMALRDEAPYKTVLTHGFMLDEDGRPMSKSEGNVIPPESIIKQYGADIIRLWVSSEDYRNDVRIGDHMLKQTADSYRKIRNTLKFIIGTLSDFSETKSISYDELSDIDKWVLHKLRSLYERVIEHYEKYEFHMVYRRLLNFCAVELSSIYFDISKDVLYIEPLNSKKRRANQTVLSEVFKTISRLIAPILSFTAEEIWGFMGNKGSVHMETYYEPDRKYINPEIDERIEMIARVKEDVLKALEVTRKQKIIGSSLEADIELNVKSEETAKILKSLGDALPRFFQAAKVVLLDAKKEGMTEYDNSAVSVARTTGKKCVRCWNYYDALGKNQEHPELCDRCTYIILDLNKE
jgi:isoleucyl-tRNA synthetase